MSTLSEVFQEKFNRRECPFIVNCNIETTNDFFSRVCKTTAYTHCNNFAYRVGELKVPLTWLQKLAVDHAMYNHDVNSEAEFNKPTSVQKELR